MSGIRFYLGLSEDSTQKIEVMGSSQVQYFRPSAYNPFLKLLATGAPRLCCSSEFTQEISQRPGGPTRN